MTGEKEHQFKVGDFYNEGPSFPDEDKYPEEEQFESYAQAGLEPSDFEYGDPDFAKRYAEWRKAHPAPAKE